jgi:hypothetical protein
VGDFQPIEVLTMFSNEFATQTSSPWGYGKPQFRAICAEGEFEEVSDYARARFQLPDASAVDAWSPRFPAPRPAWNKHLPSSWRSNRPATASPCSSISVPHFLRPRSTMRAPTVARRVQRTCWSLTATAGLHNLPHSRASR